MRVDDFSVLASYPAKDYVVTPGGGEVSIWWCAPMPFLPDFLNGVPDHPRANLWVRMNAIGRVRGPFRMADLLPETEARRLHRARHLREATGCTHLEAWKLVGVAPRALWPDCPPLFPGMGFGIVVTNEGKRAVTLRLTLHVRELSPRSEITFEGQ